MKSYLTVIEYISSSHQYRAHVREEASESNVFTTKACNTTEEALKEAQKFFSKYQLSDDTHTINSTVKNFDPPIPRSGSCCQR